MLLSENTLKELKIEARRWDGIVKRTKQSAKLTGSSQQKHELIMSGLAARRNAKMIRNVITLGSEA